jgi:hypothetical protein
MSTSAVRPVHAATAKLWFAAIRSIVSGEVQLRDLIQPGVKLRFRRAMEGGPR